MQSYNRGTEQFRKGNYKQAIVLFTRSINSNRNNADAYIYRGLSHQAINSHQSAIADYSFALEVDPDNAIAYYNRANVRKQIGDIEQARADYTTAIQLDPQYIMAYIGRGSMNQELKNYREALKDYSSAVELDQNLLTAYIGRGVVNEALGKNKQAIDDYSQAIRLDNECVIAYYNRAVIYSSLGQHQQALQDYNRAIQLDPNDSLTYYNRALTHYRLNNSKEAIRDNTRAIELDPEHAMAYNNRAIILESMGDNKAALSDYAKAIKLNPKEPSFRGNRGILYQKIRNYKGAEDDFQHALLAQPGNPVYLFHLADNEPESIKARRHLEKGLQTFNSLSSTQLRQMFHLSDEKISKTKNQINIFYDVLSRLDNAQHKANKLQQRQIAEDTFNLRDQIKLRFIGKMKAIQDRDDNRKDSIRSSSLEVINENEEKYIEDIERELNEMDKKIASRLYQYGSSTSQANNNSGQNFKRQSFNGQQRKPQPEQYQSSQPEEIQNQNYRGSYIGGRNPQNNYYAASARPQPLPRQSQTKQIQNQNSRGSYIGGYGRISQQLRQGQPEENDDQKNFISNHHSRAPVAGGFINKGMMSSGYRSDRQSQRQNQKYQPEANEDHRRTDKIFEPQRQTLNEQKDNDSDNESMRSSKWARENNQRNRLSIQQPRQSNKVKGQMVESKYTTANGLFDQQASLMTKNLYTYGNNISVEKYRIKQQIEKVDKNVPQHDRVKERIKQISQFSLREYYDCMLSFMYNHLIGYRIIYSVLNLKNNDSSLQAQNTFYSISLTQPIISKIPSFGVLVQTPFQITQSFLYTDSSVLIPQVSQKIGRSSLRNYRAITEYVSVTIEELIKSKRFNDDLLFAIRQENQAYLSMMWQKISGGASMAESKKLKSILAKFSYTEQVAAAHMTLLTKAIEQADKNYFNQVTQSQGAFSEFVRNSLPPNMKIASKTAFNQADFHDMGATGIECFEDPDCRLM